MQKKLKPSQSVILDSKIWFWSVFTGVFFGLGYSITKEIYTAKIFPEKSAQEKFNQLSEKTTHQQEITIPTTKNSYIRINVSNIEGQKSRKQEFYRDSLNFFQKENVDNLIKAISNTTKAKSYKIETD
tara:strand:+ start:784 stop:1167 length:384 start_codon:yes stop_codon:yes gene_type:complete